MNENLEVIQNRSYRSYTKNRSSYNRSYSPSLICNAPSQQPRGKKSINSHRYRPLPPYKCNVDRGLRTASPKISNSLEACDATLHFGGGGAAKSRLNILFPQGMGLSIHVIIASDPCRLAIQLGGGSEQSHLQLMQQPNPNRMS